MLLYNKQPRNGTKEEILERVADGWLLGSIPECPECEQGKMTFNRFDVHNLIDLGDLQMQGIL